MLRKIIALSLLVFFVAGTFTAMAGDKSACRGKNILQGAYDWFSGLDKKCSKAAECCCKACGEMCCKACNKDCGGKCCSRCANSCKETSCKSCGEKCCNACHKDCGGKCCSRCGKM